MFLRHIISGVFAATVLAMPVMAEKVPTDALLDLLGLPKTVEVMRREGMTYGDDLAKEMLGSAGSESWDEAVARIYDPARMEATVRAGFAKAWAEEKGDIAPLTAFFGSERGQQVVQLEISARDAMANEAIEDVARSRWLELSEDDTADKEPRLKLIRQFIETNDLINANVVGGMNSSYEFYLGLVNGGAFEMSEDDILREVWSTEGETRSDTREWLFAYMLMAYKPLEPDLLEEYVTLAATENGKALNRALFAGFDRMYSDISYALGLALAQQMTAQEL